MRFFNLFLAYMVEKYQNEILPIFHYGTSLKSLRLRDLLTFGYLWLPYWALLSLTQPYSALLGLTRPYWALLGLTGPYWALFSICGLTYLLTD